MNSDHRLDHRLVPLIDLSVTALVVLVPLFIGYILAGMTAVILGLDPFPYAFLALDGDPVFVLFGTLIGIFICTVSLSQIPMVLLTESDDRTIAIHILLSMITLGFGLATLRFSMWPLLDMLRQGLI